MQALIGTRIVFTPKILVVNDHAATLLALERLLSNAPNAGVVEVIAVKSGAEALGMILRHDFAVILLDAQMPGMDGFETAGAIRARARSASIPIIFVTAHYDDEISRMKGYASGAVDFLLTPIVPGILLSKVAVFVELHRKSQRLVEMNEVLQAKERAASERELRIRTIVDNVGEGIITINEQSVIESFSIAATQMFGYATDEMIGQSLLLLMPPQMRSRHEEGMRRYLAGEAPKMIGKKGIELPGLHKNGTVFPMELALMEMVHAGRRLFVGIVRDITERKMAENAIFAEKERLRITLNSIGEAIGDAVITIDTAGSITYLNPVAINLTGWQNSEAAGLPLTTAFNIIYEKNGEPAANPATLALLHQQAHVLQMPILLKHRDGRQIAIEASAAPIFDRQNDILGVVLVFRDVSHARQMAAQMTYQASHDALTGLINRREFECRVEQAIQTGTLQGKQHTLLYLDLDQFKVVNDTCGHGAGDELLRQLTSMLEGQLRQSDTLGRLGGDEFGVLLDGCAAAPALRIADQLRKTVSDFHFVWLDKVFSVGASIGLVAFGHGDATLADILRMADAACYVAKDKGRNRIHVYTPEDQELARRQDEMGWVGRIRTALDEQRFILYSQKIQPLGATAGSGLHHELLLRMQQDDGKLVPPMAFIPAAERYNLMPAIDRWVIQEAFSRHAADPALQAGDGMCAINLSGASICDDQFLHFIREQFKRYPVPPAGICFEITETSAIANLTQAAVLIRELKTIGCRIALDDFGSGMSSFAYLKHLRVDYLKIDGGFVRDMTENPIDFAMVEAINKIGHVMGIQTIAEYVESEATLEALRRIGVDFAQGYAVEKPRLAWPAPAGTST